MTIASYTSWDELENKALFEWLKFNTNPVLAETHHMLLSETQLKHEVRRLFENFHTSVYALWSGEDIVANLTVLRYLPDSGSHALPDHAAMCCQFQADAESSSLKLFAHVFEDLRQQNVTRLIGPIHGDTWHYYRMNLGPWDSSLFLMEPNNPKSYPEYWEAAGFTSLATYHSSKVNDISNARMKMERSRKWADDHDIIIEDIQGQSLDTVLQRIHALTLKSFGQNFLYEPIDLEHFLQLYNGVNALIHQRLLLFARRRDGEDLGYVFAFPGYNPEQVQAVKRGEVMPTLGIWWTRRKPKYINVKTLGVIPMPRRAAVGMAMMHELYYRIEKMHSVTQVNLCLIKDDNASRGLDGGQGKLLRCYALYEKQLNNES